MLNNINSTIFDNGPIDSRNFDELAGIVFLIIIYKNKDYKFLTITHSFF